MAVITLLDVTAGDEGRPPISRLSLEVHEGEALILADMARDAQDLLPRLILGLERPHTGIIRLFDHPVSEANEALLLSLRKRVAYVPAGGLLLANHSLFDNIALPLRYHRVMDDQSITRLVRKGLEETGLLEAAERRPFRLSPAQRVLGSLLRAMVCQPAAALVVDPFDGMDAAAAHRVGLVLEDLIDRGAAVLVTTHVANLETNYDGRLAQIPGRRIVHGGP